MTLAEFKMLLLKHKTRSRHYAKVVVLSAKNRNDLLDEFERLNFNRSGFILDRGKHVFIDNVLVKDEADS